MDRRSQLLRFISPRQLGIEIGPYFAPIAPKREGYNCLALDVFDTATLQKRASEDPNIPKECLQYIENVDLVGSSSDIAEIVSAKHKLGSFDYILSSHNLEHMPNPLKFLQGCAAVLKPDGMLCMALPDKRTCFDYFRPLTITADWLEAYFGNYERPTQKQIFEQNSLHCRYRKDGKELASFTLEEDPSNIIPLDSLREAFINWKAFIENPDDIYRDTHCWKFTPASFELMLRDLQFLGLVDLAITEVSEVHGHEFFVHMKNTAFSTKPLFSDTTFYTRRHALLHRINNEASANSVGAYAAKSMSSPQKTLQHLKHSLRDSLPVAMLCVIQRVLHNKLRSLFATKEPKSLGL